ncbi:MAG: c-type cytochrome [Gemmatimonadota bacterium]
MRREAVALLLALGAVACGKHEFEPPDREARVAEAERLYSAALFDTVTWASDSLRLLDGNAVYASECRKCHGTLGRGDGPFGATRGLEVPSLVEPDWPLASLDSVRHRVFVGHAAGMPTWGVAGITPREIDAVAFYILNGLRPDVLGDEGSS